MRWLYLLGGLGIGLISIGAAKETGSGFYGWLIGYNTALLLSFLDYLVRFHGKSEA